MKLHQKVVNPPRSVVCFRPCHLFSFSSFVSKFWMQTKIEPHPSSSTPSGSPPPPAAPSHVLPRPPTLHPRGPRPRFPRGGPGRRLSPFLTSPFHYWVRVGNTFLCSPSPNFLYGYEINETPPSQPPSFSLFVDLAKLGDPLSGSGLMPRPRPPPVAGPPALTLRTPRRPRNRSPGTLTCWVDGLRADAEG